MSVPFASPVPAARRDVKARPAGLSGWKAHFLQQCEDRVKARRHELIDSLRKRSATAADLMTDLVADEQARRLDASPGGSPLVLRRAGASDDDGDDADLTPEERLELLLYLQATLYSEADEDEARALLASLEAAEQEEVAARVDWAEGGAGGGDSALHPAEVFALLSPAAGGVGAQAAAAFGGVFPPGCFQTPPGAGGRHLSRMGGGGVGAGAAAAPPGGGAAAAAAAMLDDDSGAACPPPPPTLLQSDVLCPLCRKRCLFVLETVVGCRCGLRLNTAHGLTIAHLQSSLAETYATHRAGGCAEEPVYEVRDYFGIDALWMLCASCEDLQVVL